METKEQLINDLIQLNTILEEVWSYHPDNPSRIDVEDTYNMLVNQISNLKKIIDEIQ